MKSFRCLTGANLLVATTILLVPAQVRGQSSNRDEVRGNLERDGWRVVWGKNFTEAD